MTKYAEIVIASLKAREKDLRARVEQYEQGLDDSREMFTLDERRGALAVDMLSLIGNLCETRARLSVYSGAENYTAGEMLAIRKYYEDRRETALQAIRLFDGTDGADAFRRVKERFVVKECSRALFMLDGLDDMEKTETEKGAAQNA